MLGISGLGFSSYQNPYASAFASRRMQQSNAAQQAQNASTRTAGRTAVIPAAQTGTPVQPVDPVKAPPSVELDQKGMADRLENDPAAAVMRGRIQYNGERPGTLQGAEQTAEQVSAAGTKGTADVPGSFQAERGSGSYNVQRAIGDMEMPSTGGPDASFNVPGAVPTPYDSDLPADDAEDAAKADLPGAKQGKDDPAEIGGESKTAQEVAEEGECQTCKNRKYQDGSDDPGVSFKTPTHISPDQAAAAVAGHENEHVVREQAKAAREDRRVVSQSVTYRTAICPECGRSYISGGTTRTVTAANEKPEDNTVDGVGASDGGKDAKKGEFKLPGSKDDKADKPEFKPLGAKDDGADKPEFRLPGSKDDKADKAQFKPLGAKDDSAQKPQYKPLGSNSSVNGNAAAGQKEQAGNTNVNSKAVQRGQAVNDRTRAGQRAPQTSLRDPNGSAKAIKMAADLAANAKNNGMGQFAQRLPSSIGAMGWASF